MRASWQPPHRLCKGKLNPAWKGGQVLCQPHKKDCTSSQLQRGNCLNRLPRSEWYVHARGADSLQGFCAGWIKEWKTRGEPQWHCLGVGGEVQDVTWGLEELLSWIICWQPFQSPMRVVVGMIFLRLQLLGENCFEDRVGRLAISYILWAKLTLPMIFLVSLVWSTGALAVGRDLSQQAIRWPQNS